VCPIITIYNILRLFWAIIYVNSINWVISTWFLGMYVVQHSTVSFLEVLLGDFDSRFFNPQFQTNIVLLWSPWPTRPHLRLLLLQQYTTVHNSPRSSYQRHHDCHVPQQNLFFTLMIDYQTSLKSHNSSYPWILLQVSSKSHLRTSGNTFASKRLFFFFGRAANVFV